MTQIKQDQRFMAAALRLARRGLGRTWPNPSVGAIIVDENDRIVGAGRTGDGGRPHAETVALDIAGEKARGATLYVTLEPCAHHGQTPPCADAIVAAGIARLVCGADDPDRRVAGHGFQRLLNAGIAVERGVLARQAHRVCAGHITRVTKHRPYIQLKLAVSENGLIAGPENRQVSITGAMANAWVHRMRAMADAIMVGIATAQTDNPALTCRLPGAESLSPIRIVADRQLRIGLDSQLVQTAAATPMWIMTSENASNEHRHALETRNVRLLTARTANNGKLDLADVMRILADEGITRLMVEGGAQLARSLCSENLADEIVFIQGASLIEENGLKAFVDSGPELIRESGEYCLLEEFSLGDDRVQIYQHRD
ncbi:MAG: bifunctional diaminohydroxyphosphoribosylaminopyrimidine deaminase/5-amino-6-(5-phosphoribosylamino)uracil reductase RibD [Fimbriimonadaceae bacterium]|nr:bifunctional diaminohydroxyphosphoribosylaminopyrimidine deaminase/5-amino-6-(5-phosphoribosylamino)uracil reductase RibD [Alphaproteobacteria bacterium]